MILGNSQISQDNGQKRRATSSAGKTRRKVKRAAQRARSMSFFTSRLSKNSGTRTFSIFGNRLKRYNNEKVPNIMSTKFVLRDPTGADRYKAPLSAGQVRLNPRQKMKKAVRRTVSLKRLSSKTPRRSSRAQETTYEFHASAVKRVRHAVKHINRLANMVQFFHYESDQHDHGKDGPASKVESLSELLDSLRKFYDPDGEHAGNPHYSDMALLQREAIKWNPRVRRILDKLWNLTDKDHDQHIEKEEYVCMCMKVYRVVVDDDPDPKLIPLRREYAEADWEGDHMGYENLNKNRFTRAWFQLADHWTHDVSAPSYADFLERIYCAVAVKSTVTNKIYWKADADIRKLKKNSRALLDESDTIHLLYEDTRNSDRYKKLYLSEKKKTDIANRSLLRKKMDKVDLKYDRQRLRDKLVEENWMNKSVKEVFHTIDNQGVLEEDVKISPTAARKAKSGIFVGSNISPPCGWENLSLAPWSSAFQRISLDEHGNSAIDVLARSKILAAVRAGMQGNSKKRFMLSDLTPQQRQVQRLILLDLREKYLQLSRSNDINPVFFTRIDEMMENVDNMNARERQMYQPGRSFDKNLESQNTLQRPSSAPNLHLRDQRSITEYLNNHREDTKRPSTAGRAKRKIKYRHGKMKRKYVLSAPPIDDDAPRGGLVVFSKPPTIFGRTKETVPLEKKKKVRKRKKTRLRRKKPDMEEKDRIERRTITIHGLVPEITTENIRATFKCWNKTVKRMRRDNANTVKITFATHRDFRDSMRMLKILASSNASDSHDPPEAALSRTLSNASSYVTQAESRASLLAGSEPDLLEDDFMYGLTHIRPHSPPISPIKIPKRLHQLHG